MPPRPRRSPGFRVERLDHAAAEGSNSVWFGSAVSVIKFDEDGTNPGLVAIEFICTRIAMTLGVPVPMGDAGVWDGQLVFVSAQIDLEGQLLPPADLEEAKTAMSADAARIFVFDVLIHNDDRTEENLLYHPKVGLWAIDHEQALGGPTVLEPYKLFSQRDQAISTPGFVPKELEPNAIAIAVAAVQSLPGAALRAAVEEARMRRLLDAAQANGVFKFLDYRRKHIGKLVSKSIDPKGGTEWQTTETPLPPGT